MNKLNFALAYFTAAVTAPKKDEKGAAAVEYALLVAGIAIGLFVAIGVFGTALSEFFTGLAGEVGIGGE